MQENTRLGFAGQQPQLRHDSQRVLGKEETPRAFDDTVDNPVEVAFALGRNPQPVSTGLSGATSVLFFASVSRRKLKGRLIASCPLNPTRRSLSWPRVSGPQGGVHPAYHRS